MLNPTIDSHGYKRLNLYNNGKKRTAQMIHRLVAEAFFDNPDNKRCVDHIDRNKLNNHISNLRYATTSQNAMNKSIQSNNTSGIVGVYFCKDKNKWRAVIKKDRNPIHLGYVETKEGAIEARNKAE